MQNPQKKQAVINDLLVTYYMSKKGKKGTLLFLHGWRSNSTLWFSVLVPFIEAGYTVYCVDLPGFGESQLPKKPWTLADYCVTVKLFIEKIGEKNVTLIGHSFGGAVGIKLAAHHPEFVDKLILVDGSGIRKASLGKSLKYIVAKLVKPFFLLPFTKPLRAKLYNMMGAEDYLATPELRQTYLNIINEDLRAQISELRSPTLLIWGENDQDTPLSNAQEMKLLTPNSELRTLSNAGHFSFLDNPSEFTNALQEFLTS